MIGARTPDDDRRDAAGCCLSEIAFGCLSWLLAACLVGLLVKRRRSLPRGRLRAEHLHQRRHTRRASQGPDRAFHQSAPERRRGAHRAMSSRIAEVRQSGHQ